MKDRDQKEQKQGLRMMGGRRVTLRSQRPVVPAPLRLRSQRPVVPAPLRLTRRSPPPQKALMPMTGSSKESWPRSAQPASEPLRAPVAAMTALLPREPSWPRSAQPASEPLRAPAAARMVMAFEPLRRLEVPWKMQKRWLYSPAAERPAFGPLRALEAEM